MALLIWAPLTDLPIARVPGRATRQGGAALRERVWRWTAQASERLQAVRLPAPVARWTGQVLRHPARLVLLGFAVAVVMGWGLLMLPAVTETGRSAGAITALFTATSAVCVTGLVIVDTGSHWSGLGEVIILWLIEVGGFGIMTWRRCSGCWWPAGSGCGCNWARRPRRNHGGR
ncbi:hypothetical protein AB0F81_45260 [Actinoplanes sp. NPDC024001]|uniref:hypothetical protein n=1 Tax=Actinoplanes sp. NPDC024001 TaxID=3154598 RepID=UPI0033FBD5F1